MLQTAEHLLQVSLPGAELVAQELPLLLGEGAVSGRVDDDALRQLIHLHAHRLSLHRCKQRKE